MATIDEIVQNIVRKADIQDRETPGLARMEWYPGPWCKPGEVSTIIKHGERLALNPEMIVFRMFEDETEYRVYTLQVRDPKAPPPPAELPPTCFHLQKAARIYSTWSMSLPFWEDEIAGELRELAGVGPDDEDDEGDEEETEGEEIGLAPGGVVSVGAPATMGGPAPTAPTTPVTPAASGANGTSPVGVTLTEG